MKKSVFPLLIHLLFWAAFFLLPLFFFTPPPVKVIQISLEKIPYTITLTNILTAAVFYINYYFFIPHYVFKKKYAAFSLLLVVTVIVYLLIPAACNEILQKLGINISFENSLSLPIGPITMIALALSLSSILRITNEWKLARAAKDAMEKEKNTAEIALLKNQINPHFLFNTLNGIYAMSLKKSDHTPSAIIKLSNMMRYVLYESEHDSVPLTKEIKYIEAYIELQQLRINEKNIVHFEVTGDSDSFFIAPMLLIPFVENAFKYGICADTPTETLMKIECFNNTLHFYSRNSKFIKHNNLHKGIGIANVKRRLELFYEGDYMLDIKETENQFIVQLEIKLFS